MFPRTILCLKEKIVLLKNLVFAANFLSLFFYLQNFLIEFDSVFFFTVILCVFFLWKTNFAWKRLIFFRLFRHDSVMLVNIGLQFLFSVFIDNLMRLIAKPYFYNSFQATSILFTNIFSSANECEINFVRMWTEKKAQSMKIIWTKIRFHSITITITQFQSTYSAYSMSIAMDLDVCNENIGNQSVNAIFE